MEVFGDVDKARSGVIASQMPAWYFETQIDELREEIRRKTNDLDRGVVPADQVPEARAILARDKEKLEKIEGSRPKIGDKERDLLNKHYKELGQLISDTMFSYDDMNRGTANVHEEARRMKDPVISLNNQLKTLAKSCNVKITRAGKVGRDGAAKLFKITGRLIGEPTNIERLRN